jgi:sugar (pentulose or hexulose) kinase
MASEPLILAIDSGTQSVRASLIDLRGGLAAKAQVALRPPVSPRPGWSEEDPEYYWQSLGEACRKLWEQEGPRKAAVAGVALTGQRATVVNVGEDGKPLRPAILWLDHRRTEGLPPVGGPWGMLFRLAGVKSTVDYLLAEAEVNWIRTHEPEVWKRTHKYLLLTGFLTHRLTGRYVDSVGCQVGYLPFDYKRLRWAASWDWKWRAVPMEPSVLSDLVEPGSPMGVITREAAEATGIPPGLPVIAAASDKACEVLGAGCLAPDLGCLGHGTTATLNVMSGSYKEAIRLLPPYPAALPHAYNLEVEIYRGYWMVSWFKREFALREAQDAESRGLETEALFDSLVESVPAGSQGLVLQPYWSPGLKVPGPEARGAIVGFTDVHTRAHLYRAILEGLAYGLREGRERIERRTGVPMRALRVCGGGSRSDAAMQITADVFGLPTARPHLYETSSLGAAIDAAVGLGLHASFDAAVKEMTRTGDTFEPDPARRALYDDLYRTVYRPLYGRLQPLYRSLRELLLKGRL